MESLDLVLCRFRYWGEPILVSEFYVRVGFGGLHN